MTTASIAGVVAILNHANYVLSGKADFWSAFLISQIWGVWLVGLFFVATAFGPSRIIQVFQACLFLVLSGPTLLDSKVSFFGFWFFILGIVLLYKYRLLEKHGTLVLGTATAYFVTLLSIAVIQAEGTTGSVIRIINNFVFLASCLVFLFFIFEQEIRDLVLTNRKKDLALADQAATIARLEPLSVLGERVAHVTHSFKNNLSQIGTALYYLEQGNDPEKAKRKIEQFAKTMNERIDNILMVSRAGADQTVEVFDAARVLSGLNQVYLTEPKFLQQAKVELDITEATAVEAVRWDFLLLAENILKNALDALTAKGIYGTIRVILKDRLLTLANNGGAMELCATCPHDSCLECPNYGRPGQTTKTTGSGHGLAQVFATCRKYGWTLKIRTEGEWTLFEIGF